MCWVRNGRIRITVPRYILTMYSRYLCQEDQHAVSCVSLLPYQTPTRVLAWCLDRMDAEVMHSDGDGGGPAEGSVAHKYANVPSKYIPT